MEIMSNLKSNGIAQFKPGSEGLLAPLMPWFEDSSVSEILINKPGEVFIEQKGAMTRFDMPVLNALHLKRLFNFIANENGQTIGEDRPILSGNLFDGSRVQLVLPPASRYYTLSIRRKTLLDISLDHYTNTPFFERVKPFYLDDDDNAFLSNNDKTLLELYYNEDWEAFLRAAINFKKNIVVSGATSSGKTTFLNACIKEIPLNERIITLEDTYELEPPHQNLVSLFAPKKTKETDKGVSMQDLVQCSLRLRPDRIFMGEIRGAEIMDFVSACSTGHEGSITSIHANNPRIAFARMTQLYKYNNVPSMTDADIMRELTSVIDVILQTKMENGVRKISYAYFKTAQEMRHAKAS